MSDQRKINFDDVIRRESTCEVARYFLASLDLVRFSDDPRKTESARA